MGCEHKISIAILAVEYALAKQRLFAFKSLIEGALRVVGILLRLVLVLLSAFYSYVRGLFNK